MNKSWSDIHYFVSAVRYVQYLTHAPVFEHTYQVYSRTHVCACAVLVGAEGVATVFQTEMDVVLHTISQSKYVIS